MSKNINKENNISALRKNDFPIFKRKINGKPLVYLDSAATSQKPQAVIDSLIDYYQNHNANVHRGIHTLGDESTKMYDSARQTVAEFIGAADSKEIIFVRNTTEAINLVAYAWGRNNIKAGDEVIISEMEHHSNLVPWQMLAEEKGAIVRFINVTSEGKLDLGDFKRKLNSKTKIVSVVHVSNFLGTINPIAEISKLLRPSSFVLRPLFLVDGAQAVPHMPVNVKDLGCDFYAFSGHKMYGPMGIGCLWGKKKILEEMSPFLTGGGMINTVSKDRTAFTDLPDKFEAGTPNVAGAVGLAAAVKYLEKIGMENVRKHEIGLIEYVMKQLSAFVIPRAAEGRPWGSSQIAASSRPRVGAPRNDDLSIKIYGPGNSKERGGLIAFTVEVNGKEVHGHDVAQILDSHGIAVRSGHHCVMPMHEKLGLAATTRISFGIYNTEEDVDRLMEALGKIPDVFGI